jgi:diguanylate cyclase
MLSPAIQSARTDLLHGLGTGAVRLAYQPQIEIESGAVCGFEAVVRWDHPQLGTLAPGLFLGLAAREGVLGLMSRTLLAQAAGTVAGWRAEGFPVTVSLNLGASDLTDTTFAADALAAVRGAAARPDWLVLEAGEEALASRGEAGLAGLEELRMAGFQVALDAKGPPAIALDTRSRALFAQLKCGGTTMLRVARRLLALDASLFARRIETAKAAGLTVVAVGAESEGAVALFRSFGFDLVQGNAFSPPVPADDALALLRGHPVSERPADPLPYVPLSRLRAPEPAVPVRRGLRLTGVEVLEPPAEARIGEPAVPADDWRAVWG